MTQNEKAIAIGCYRMGATIEQICFALKIDGLIVQRIINDFKENEASN